MTSKQRARLKSAAAFEESIFQIGKEGVTDGVAEAVRAAISKRELIKLTVLKTSDEGPEQVLQLLCQRLGAEPVAAIGNKIIMFKRSDDKRARRIEL